MDEAKTTGTAHALTCLVEGCGQVRMETHEWDWRHMGYGSDAEGGTFYRSCLLCEYPDYDYRPVDTNGKTVNWTTKNVLVTAKNAQVSRVLAVTNDNLTLRINNSLTLGKRCTGWTVTYTTPNGRTNNITFRYSFQENDDGSWSTTILTAGWPAGGILLFTPPPTLEACSSHSYITDSYIAPVCMYDGFAGYRICKYCHTPDPTDTSSDEARILPATSKTHTGGTQLLYQKEVTSPTGKKTITWTANKSESNGKRYNYVADDCHTKGCAGDTLCTDCKRVIPGKRQYQHPAYAIETRNYRDVTCFKDGYSGDEYCTLCNRIVDGTQGYTIPAPKQHTTTTEYLPAVAPTCTTAGKGAVERCMLCNEFLYSDLYIAPLGHDWAVDEANCTATTTAYKCSRAGCTATKFEAITNKHTITVDGGAAYLGGKAVTKAGEGQTVTLKCNAVPQGKRFQEWEVISGGVALTNAASPDHASFIMGSQDVSISAVFANDSPTHFTDVPAGSYYEDAVSWAVGNGITYGTTETTFSPNENCTRAQIVTFLWRALAGS